jgi:hypothetical protein
VASQGGKAGQPEASQRKPKRIKTVKAQAGGQIHTIGPGENAIQGVGHTIAHGNSRQEWVNDQLEKLHADLQEGAAAKAELGSLKKRLRRMGGAAEGPAPVPAAAPPPKPPALERGLRGECDELARKKLRELGWGQEPASGECWILTAGQVKQLWRLSCELWKDCPVQGKYTSEARRRIAMRHAFRRVTGS